MFVLHVQISRNIWTVDVVSWAYVGSLSKRETVIRD